jgi:hypothetical protein
MDMCRLVHRGNQTTREPPTVPEPPADPSPPPRYKPREDVADLERELLNTFASIGMEEGAILQELEDAPEAFLEDPRPCVRRLALLHHSLVVPPSNEQRLTQLEGIVLGGVARLAIEVMKRPPEPDATKLVSKSLRAGVHYIDQRADGSVFALLLPPLARTTAGAEIRITAGGGSRSLVVVPNPGDVVDNLLKPVDPVVYAHLLRCFVVPAECYATLVAVPELSSWYVVGQSFPSSLRAGNLALKPVTHAYSGVLSSKGGHPVNFVLSRESYDDWPMRWSE